MWVKMEGRVITVPKSSRRATVEMDVGEDGSERAEVSTNVATVAAAGEKRHIVL